MLFTKIIEKPVYVDTLQDWRNTKVHDFQMLDRVWVMRTIDQSERSHPHCKWRRDIEYKPQEGIIIGTASGVIYSDVKVGEEVKHEGWDFRDKHINKTEQMEECIIYRYQKGYKVLLKNGIHVDAHTVKKSHGEFQETFEHMEILEHKKQQVIKTREAYEKSLQEVSDELDKGKQLQDKMYDTILKPQK